MNFEDKIFVGITTSKATQKENNWKGQLEEVKEHEIKKVCVFPTVLDFEARKEFYKELEKSGVKEIPLVHIRAQNFTEEELDYFITKFKTKWFNCHEKDSEIVFNRHPKHRKKILLEFDHNNKVENKIQPEEVGGLCIDISHYRESKEIGGVECKYILKHAKQIKANHLNGFDDFRKDTHHLKHKYQLDYLKELPKKLFSNSIALEMDNSIKEQLKFKKYIVKILNEKFN